MTPIPILLMPLAALALARAEAPSALELVRKIDQLYRAESSRAVMEMTIETPDWSRTLRLRIWTRGMDETFLTVLEPKKDRGVSTLRKDAEMWNYFPKIDKVIKVPPSMMSGSWMGSDFTNDDLVRESSLEEDYEFSYAPAQPEGFHVVVLTPRKDVPTVWGRIELKIRKEDLLPVEETYFDEAGEKIRVLALKELKAMGGRRIPTVMELDPLKKKGHRTTIRYVEAEFGIPLPPDTFTLRNLRAER